MRRFFVTVTLCLTLFSLACGPSNNSNHGSNANHTASTNANGNRAGGGGVVSDAWVTAKIKLALIAEGRTSGFETDVITKDGVVTLSGKVDTDEAAKAATEVAGKVEGVKSVNNQLQVVPEAKRKDVNAADDKINDAIEKAMDTDPSLKDLSLAAESNAGVVTLSGSADNQDELIKAARALRKIPGVKTVVTTGVTITNEGKS